MSERKKAFPLRALVTGHGQWHDRKRTQPLDSFSLEQKPWFFLIPERWHHESHGPRSPEMGFPASDNVFTHFIPSCCVVSESQRGGCRTSAPLTFSVASGHGSEGVRAEGDLSLVKWVLQRVLREDLCSPKIHTLTSEPTVPQNGIIFGKRALREVIKLKWSHWGGP